MSRPSPAVQSVLEIARERGQVTAPEVVEVLSISSASARNRLLLAKAGGHLVTLRRGVYVVPKAAPAVPAVAPAAPSPLPADLVGIPHADHVPPYLLEGALAALLHAGRQLARMLDQAGEGTALAETLEGMLREQSRQGGLLRTIQELAQQRTKGAQA